MSSQGSDELRRLTLEKNLRIIFAILEKCIFICGIVLFVVRFSCEDFVASETKESRWNFIVFGVLAVICVHSGFGIYAVFKNSMATLKVHLVITIILISVKMMLVAILSNFAANEFKAHCIFLTAMIFFFQVKYLLSLIFF